MLGMQSTQPFEGHTYAPLAFCSKNLNVERIWLIKFLPFLVSFIEAVKLKLGGSGVIFKYVSRKPIVFALCSIHPDVFFPSMIKLF